MAAEILTGREALEAVASPKGQWNWALVGPDPKNLPLAGGGSGSIDEMRECLCHQEKSAVLFGLLRLNFGTGRIRVNRHVFVMASGIDEAFSQGEGSNMVARGKAMNKRPMMEKELDAIAHSHAKIVVQHKTDLSVENIIETLKKSTTADAELVTVENFNIALAEFKDSLNEEGKVVEKPKPKKAQAGAGEAGDKAATEDNPGRPRASSCAAPPPPEIRKELPELETDEVVEEEPAAAESEPAPAEVAAVAAPAAATPVPELRPVSDEVPAAAALASALASAQDPEKRVLKEPVGLVKGDLVEVFSASSNKWHDDGVVLQVLDSSDMQDGLSLPAGSVKIQYQNDHRLKWIPPCHLSRCLRKSERPRPPKALTGELLKETHNWVAEWHVRYFQLKRGWLQWWVNREDAVEGVKPNGALDLTGLAVGSAGTVFSMRTANSKGVVYNFDARNVDDVATWMQGLKEHAMYIDKMKLLMATRNHADYA